MGTFLNWLIGFDPPPKVIVVRQRAAQPVALPVVPATRAKNSRTIVERTPSPYWVETGWERNGGNYKGNYVTPQGRWRGSITVSPGGRIEAYILNPPAALKEHPHWHCFMKRESGWYFVHTAEPIQDVSSVIITVEKIIKQAYEA
jgi:hypothetical protein